MVLDGRCARSNKPWRRMAIKFQPAPLQYAAIVFDYQRAAEVRPLSHYHAGPGGAKANACRSRSHYADAQRVRPIRALLNEKREWNYGPVQCIT